MSARARVGAGESSLLSGVPWCPSVLQAEECLVFLGSDLPLQQLQVQKQEEASMVRAGTSKAGASERRSGSGMKRGRGVPVLGAAVPWSIPAPSGWFLGSWSRPFPRAAGATLVLAVQSCPYS